MPIEEKFLKYATAVLLSVGMICCTETESTTNDAGHRGVVGLSSDHKVREGALVLATVNGRAIYESDLSEFIQSGLSAQSKEDALEKVINEYLLADEAIRRGYGERRAVFVAYQKALAREMLVKTGLRFTEKHISQDILKKEYQRQKERFVHGTMRKVVHALVIVSKEKKPSDKDWNLARRIHEVVKGVETEKDFKKAVEIIKGENDDYPIKVEDIFSFDEKTSRLVKPFVDGTFAVNFPRERISKIVQTRFGLHIIFVESEKAAENVSFEDAKSQLAKELLPAQRSKHVADFIEKLVAEGGVFIFDEVLSGMSNSESGS